MKRILCCLVTLIAMTQAQLAGQDLEDRIRQLEEQLALLREEIRALHRQSEAASPPAKSTAEEPSPPTHSQQTPGPGDMRVHWDKGLRLDSRDGRFNLRFGGRIHSDMAFLSTDRSLEDSIGVNQDGAEIRRARLFASGTINGRIEYRAQFDFSGAAIETAGTFKDVYVGLNQLPVFGRLRIGHFKEPFGLEELTSTNNGTFMERSVTVPFTPSRNVGAAFQNAIADQRLTYSAGLFRDSNDVARSLGSDGWNYTGRVTGLPVYADQGRRLLHLGGALSRQGVPLGFTRFRARPEAHLALRFVNTGLFDSNSVDLLGLEAASVTGPFSLQSEYVRANTDSQQIGDPSFHAFYVTGSFFTTGEHRIYRKSSGTFGRIIPKTDLLDGGFGAWELAARYSQMDLNDAAVRGGEMKNFTLGLNWYLNAHTRVMWNYLHSKVKDTGDADIVQMRLKIDF